MLEEGTTATDYEPYGVMPSPDYPSEIENIEGNIEVKVEGKNLVNIPDITLNNANYIYNGDIDLKPNTYTLSMTEKAQDSFSIAIVGENGTLIGGSITLPYTFTIEENAISMRLYSPGAGTFKGVQIEEGTQATQYEPYKSQVETFPLSEGQKLMEGSYLAYDGIHNARGQIVFDGSEDEDWYIQNNTFRRSLTNAKGNGKVFSNYFIDKNTNNTGDYIWLFLDGYVLIKMTSITTLSDFKTWLSTHNLIVEYELAEEEIVPYTAEQQEAWDKIESMKLYDGVNHIESTSEIDIKYNYIYKKPSIKNKSDIENKISSGEYQTIINNKRYFVFLEEELKSVRNDITDRLYIDTNKNIAKVMKRVDKLVLNGTEEWNVNATHSNVFYTAKPKNMADNETNIFCTITDEFSKDLSGETYGILIDTNINIKIPKVKTVADLKAYLAKEPITIQYKATEEIKDIILLSKPSSYWTTCEDEFKYPQMQKTTNKRGCVADVIGEEIDVFCKTNKEQFEKIATHKNATGYAVNRIKKKKWKSIQLKFSSNKSFELFSCTLESYIGSYIKR